MIERGFCKTVEVAAKCPFFIEMPTENSYYARRDWILQRINDYNELLYLQPTELAAKDMA